MLEAKRREQRRCWLWDDVQAALIDRLRRNPESAAIMHELERQVMMGDILPSAAARKLIDKIDG